MKIAYLFLNGELKGNKKFYLDFTENNKGDIYCADGGANICYELDLIPKEIYGDLDSIKNDVKEFYQEKNVNFIKFKVEKDYTDGELVLNEVQDKDKNENDIFIAGDFNLYALDESFRPLYKHADKITYAIDSAIKTTIGTKGRANSYDNFFFSQKYSQEFTGSSGALDFSGDNPKLMREIISDHIPVFIVVETSKDDD